ncbi:hypothetical protein EDD86DRAFT_113419 [Gorgonomyces haynaldii]|nr:hypothetical protein EDD86DRAFT_113419 [Gorgonomyces haynaldii]
MSSMDRVDKRHHRLLLTQSDVVGMTNTSHRTVGECECLSGCDMDNLKSCQTLLRVAKVMSAFSREWHHSTIFTMYSADRHLVFNNTLAFGSSMRDCSRMRMVHERTLRRWKRMQQTQFRKRQTQPGSAHSWIISPVISTETSSSSLARQRSSPATVQLMPGPEG